MTPAHTPIRTPVRRIGADRNLLIALLVFATTVSLTRLFLRLTGYPQVGGGTLHIAHLMWGGLLLFAASMLPLLFSNRWVYPVNAALAGAGVGLFIDEVGKFITRTNDYFYPPAAPIIYTFFLLILLVYLQVRRPPSRDVRAALYHVFEDMQEVLDHDLEPSERAELEIRLQKIALHSNDEEYARLAAELLHFLESTRLHLAPEQTNWLERVGMAWDRLEHRRISRGQWRVALAGGWTALGAMLIGGFFHVLLSLRTMDGLQAMLSEWILHGLVRGSSAFWWFLAQVILEGVVGCLLILSAVLLLWRKERMGITGGILGLLMILAGINLLSFYFDQFATILPAAMEFLLLVASIRFRRRYLLPIPRIETSLHDPSLIIPS
jgi:hypothetical protein